MTNYRGIHLVHSSQVPSRIPSRTPLYDILVRIEDADVIRLAQSDGRFAASRDFQDQSMSHDPSDGVAVRSAQKSWEAFSQLWEIDERCPPRTLEGLRRLQTVQGLYYFAFGRQYERTRNEQMRTTLGSPTGK